MESRKQKAKQTAERPRRGALTKFQLSAFVVSVFDAQRITSLSSFGSISSIQPPRTSAASALSPFRLTIRQDARRSRQGCPRYPSFLLSANLLDTPPHALYLKSPNSEIRPTRSTRQQASPSLTFEI
jgi:hypothetical protein